MIRLQRAFEWIDKLLGSQVDASQLERVPPTTVSPVARGVLDLSSWSLLAEPQSARWTAAGASAVVSDRVPQGEWWWVPFYHVTHNVASPTTRVLETSLVINTGEVAGAFLPTILGTSQARTVRAFTPVINDRPVLVTSGNQLRGGDQDANLQTMTLEALIFRIPPGTYVPGSPFG